MAEEWGKIVGTRPGSADQQEADEALKKIEACVPPGWCVVTILAKVGSSEVRFHTNLTGASGLMREMADELDRMGHP